VDLTDEQKRRIAALRTIPGYKLLLEVVVKEARDAAQERLKTARGRDEILEAAMDYRAWEKVSEMLERVPRVLEEELKEKGDFVYASG